MPFRFASATLALLILFLPATLLRAEPGGPQYVLVSFDGASHIEQWERSRRLGLETGARFTYFLSCAYLLTPRTRDVYRGPGMAPGRSNVGTGLSRENVRQRLNQIWLARTEGHEIANHGCGHFDGGAWDSRAWRHEFGQFRTILREAWSINDIEGEPDEWRDFAEHEIDGFRAPYLATSPGLFGALATEGFRYDASTVAHGPQKPVEKGGVRRFALPLIREGPRARRIIAMDYNLFVRHSGGMDRPSQKARFEERAYSAFKTAFDEEYESGRRPLQIGFHFTLMNGGAYWRALERFAADVCLQEAVRCVSYRQYLDDTAPAAADHTQTADG